MDVQAPTIQESLAAVEQIGIAAAAPFVHSVAGQAKVQTIAAEVNLGIAALPLFANLFQMIAHLFHHAHQAATAAPAPAAPAPDPAAK